MKKQTINFLNNLKNNSIKKKEFFNVIYSTHILKLIFCLYEQGYIQSYEIKNENKITIFLRYYYNNPVFHNIKIISKPSNIKFLKFEKLILLKKKKSTLFVSTDKGVFTLDQCQQKKLGGILLFSC